MQKAEEVVSLMRTNNNNINTQQVSILLFFVFCFISYGNWATRLGSSRQTHGSHVTSYLSIANLKNNLAHVEIATCLFFYIFSCMIASSAVDILASYFMYSVIIFSLGKIYGYVCKLWRV